MTFASCPPAPWSTAESWLCSLSVRPLGATRNATSVEARVKAGETHVLGGALGNGRLPRLAGVREFDRGVSSDGDPWTQQLTIDVVDAAHPATSCLPSPWRIHDELYLFRELRQDVRVLLRLRPDDLDMKPPRGEGAGDRFPSGMEL